MKITHKNFTSSAKDYIGNQKYKRSFISMNSIMKIN